MPDSSKFHGLKAQLEKMSPDQKQRMKDATLEAIKTLSKLENNIHLSPQEAHIVLEHAHFVAQYMSQPKLKKDDIKPTTATQVIEDLKTILEQL